MFIKNKPITRIASLFITLALLFTSINLTPLIAFADPTGSNTSGDNSEGSVSNLGNKTYGTYGWGNTCQGYRFYIIDKNCTRQSDIYDFLYEAPSNVSTVYTNTRWEATSTDTSHWHKDSIAKLANTWCAGAIDAQDITNIPPVIFEGDSTRYVNGAEFQKWFIGISTGKGGGYSGGGIPEFGGGSSNIWTGTPNTTPGTANPNTGTSYVDLIKATAEQGKPILGSFGSINDCKTYYNKNKSTFEDNFINIQNAITLRKQNAISRAQEAKNFGLDDANAKNYAACYVYSTLPSTLGDNLKRWITCAIVHSIRFTGNTAIMDEYALSGTIISLAKNGIVTANNSSNTTNSTSNAATHSSDGLTNGILNHINKNKTSSINPTQFPLLTQNIPLAGNAYYPADKMLDKRDGIKVYNFNIDVTNDGMVTALDALRYEVDGIYQYYLVVEPLAWIYVYYTGGTAHDATRTYGSYYNLLNHYNEIQNENANGAHCSYIRELGKNSLMVKKDYLDMSKPIVSADNESRMTVSQILSEIKATNAGYGMHLYCAKDLEGGSGTSTYDHSLGTTPGPAPDPTPLPEETEFGTLSKQVTIIKNYVEKGSDGAEVTIGNYVRHENPHTITIEDEPNYKVID